MAESNNVQQSSAEEAVHEEEPRHVMSTEEKTTPAQNSDMRRKEALISEILQLQNTLHDLSQRVHCVREENEQLQVDNQVLDQYIQSVMENSDIFQPSLK